MSQFLALLLLAMMIQPPKTSEPAADSFLTIAESSDYTATATSAQVTDLIEHIRQRSTIMRVGELGKTFEGKSIPLVILANPPVESAPAAKASGKAVCFIMANIHAGEVEGKEACLELIREIGPQADHPFLKNLIVVLVPNYNADGNDRFDAGEKNRPGQLGPARVGTRANAQSLDLNRDYIKLEAPESQALVKFLSEWDPHLTIDCHTTNGSAHRYVLTYEAPLNPASHPEPIEFVRNRLLPEVTKRIKEHTGYDMWFYGNFEKDHTIWATYSAQPRFGGPYQGLRNQMSVLSEAYSYAPYKDRVIATREFIREILKFVAENKPSVIAINERARKETTERGRNPQPNDVVSIRHRIAAFNEPAFVKGYENAKGGEGGAAIDPHLDHGPPKDYPVIHLGRFEPTLSVSRPFAYVMPPGKDMDRIVEKLKQHGIVVESFKGNALTEVYTISKIEVAKEDFQGHRTVQVEVSAKPSRKLFSDGSFFVRTAQPLGTLAVYLLEPQSDDGLLTWNFFDGALNEGGEFPIARVRSADDLTR